MGLRVVVQGSRSERRFEEVGLSDGAELWEWAAVLNPGSEVWWFGGLGRWGCAMCLSDGAELWF